MPVSAKLFLTVCAGMLALTSALAAACFVKAFGITFLALPRSQSAKNAKEAPVSMRIGMFFLSLMIICFGLGASFVIKLLTRVAGTATGINVSNMKFSLNNFTIMPQAGQGVYLSVPLLACALVVFLFIGWIFYIKFLRNKSRTYTTWDCGYYKLDARNEYTATAFSKPFRIAFSFFLLPYRKTEKIRESFYHVKSFVYETHTTMVFKKYIYKPLLGSVFKTAKIMRNIQAGSIHLYLGYIFVTVFLLILFMNKF